MRVTAKDVLGKEADKRSIGSTDRSLSDDVHSKNTSLLNRISPTEKQSIGEISSERKQEKKRTSSTKIQEEQFTLEVKEDLTQSKKRLILFKNINSYN
ncbi:hypothetical protein Pst134EB_010239 [Puccinia striiformis f. sp. tritici]|nr:hypothetical protein Pst134EB_010239 [Puccinia striiformis f. sp. tritici]